MINRKMVEIFINRILIHSNGNIEVILNTGEIQNYSLPESSKKERNSEKGSFFDAEKDIQYEYGRGQYEESIRTLIEEILIKRNNEVKLLLFSYSYFQNDNCEKAKRKECNVFTYIGVLWAYIR